MADFSVSQRIFWYRSSLDGPKDIENPLLTAPTNNGTAAPSDFLQADWSFHEFEGCSLSMPVLWSSYHRQLHYFGALA